MSAWLPLPTERLVCRNFHDEFLLLRRQHATSSDIQITQRVASLPALGQRIYDLQLAFVDEVIATEVEICLRLNPRFTYVGYAVALGMVCDALKRPLASDAHRDWRLPVYFMSDDHNSSSSDRAIADAATSQTPYRSAVQSDWGLVERASGLARAEVIERLLQVELRLAMFGFLPGFAYLSGLPEALHIPRKHTPAIVAPANSLALGGKYLGIYSLPSPAGWNVIGSLGVRLLQSDKLPPIAMRPNDRVRLVRIDAQQLQTMRSSDLDLTAYNSDA